MGFIQRSPLRRRHQQRPSQTDRSLSFDPSLPRLGCGPSLSFLPTTTVLPLASFAGLLHPAADHGVRQVSCWPKPLHSPLAPHPSKLSPRQQPRSCHHDAYPLAVVRPVRLPGVATKLASVRPRPQGVDPPTSPLRFPGIAAGGRPMLPWALDLSCHAVSRSRGSGPASRSTRGSCGIGTGGAPEGTPPAATSEEDATRCDGLQPTEADRCDVRPGGCAPLLRRGAPEGVATPSGPEGTSGHLASEAAALRSGLSTRCAAEAAAAEAAPNPKARHHRRKRQPNRPRARSRRSGSAHSPTRASVPPKGR